MALAPLQSDGGFTSLALGTLGAPAFTIGGAGGAGTVGLYAPSLTSGSEQVALAVGSITGPTWTHSGSIVNESLPGQFTSTMAAANTFQVISTAAAAAITINAAATFSASLIFQVASANKAQWLANGATAFQVQDIGNSYNPLSITIGAASAAVLSVATTLDATNSTTAGVTLASGLAVAKSAQIGTSLTTGGILTVTAGGSLITGGAEFDRASFSYIDLKVPSGGSSTHRLRTQWDGATWTMQDVDGGVSILTATPGASLGVSVTAFTGTLAATASNAGAVVIGNGTAATSVAFGGGKANIGGTLAVAGACTLDSGATGSSFGGVLGIGTAANSTIGVIVASTALTGTTQYGIWSQPIFTSSATSAGVALRITVCTAASSFTCTAAYGIFMSNATIGGGSTITTQYGYYCAALSGAGTNYAFYSAGAGLVQISDTTSASSATAGAVVIGNGTAATSVAFGGGKANIGGTLAVAGACTLDTGANGSSFGGALTVGTTITTTNGNATFANTSSNLELFLNGATGGLARINYQVAGTSQFQTYGNVGSYVIRDAVNTYNPIVIGAAAVSASTVTLAGTLDATNSTTAALVGSGGAAFAKVVWAGTGFSVGTTAPTATASFVANISQNTQTAMQATNGNVGAAAYAAFIAYNGTSQTDLYHLGTAYTTSGVLVANAGGLFGNGAGGVFIASTNAAGGIAFATGGTTQCASFSSAGLFTSSIAAANTLTVTSTGNKAILNLSAASTFTSSISFTIAGTLTGTVGGNATFPFFVQDPVNSFWNVITYTANTQALGFVTLPGTLDTTATQTGALVVAGGASFGKSLCLGLVAAPGTLALGQLWQDSTQQVLFNNLGATTANLLRSAPVQVIFTSKSALTVNTFTAATSMIPSGVGTLTIPANYLVAGKTLRIRIVGAIANGGTGTLTIAGTLGATTICGFTTISLVGSGNNDYMEITIDVTLITTGTSGTVATQSKLLYSNGSTAQIVQSGFSTGAAFNSTTSAALALTMACSVSAASNGFVTTTATVEVLN